MFQLNDFERALGASVMGEKKERRIWGVSIDSRTLKPGDAFFAIKGKKLDGHRFLLEARDKGASAFVVERESWDKTRYLVSENIFLVKNTTIAFGKLARWFRQKHKARRAAITGSCGKTTTKQIAFLLLRRKYNILATEGNLNNQFGLPLTVFHLSQDHEVLLAEMGASQPGDIQYLSEILEPEVGLITNVHRAHLEGFGSVDKIYEAKLELATALEKTKGTLIVCGDNRELLKRAGKFRTRMITFGRWQENDFSITSTSKAKGLIEFEINQRYRFSIRTHALFNLDNFLAGIVLAHEMGVPFDLLEGEIRDFRPPAGRFELHTLRDGVSIIHDAYNANPGSMIRALESFSELEELGERKIAVLGDMKELGAESQEFHRQIGRELKRFHIPVLVTVGEDSLEIAKGASLSRTCDEIYSFKDNQEAISFLLSFIRPGDALLIKGSRAMKLEEIVSALSNSGEATNPSLLAQH